MPGHAPWTAEQAGEIIAAHAGGEGALLPLLHALQATFGYLPAEATALVADGLNLSRAEVHGVISFYHDFRTSPAGRHVLKLCRAEACQSVGGAALAENILTRLGIGWGETTPDGAVTVEPVYCLGLCATAPAALVDGEVIGRLTPEHIQPLLAAVTP